MNGEKTMNYIHYGSKYFDVEKFKNIKNVDCFDKPFGGEFGLLRKMQNILGMSYVMIIIFI